MIQNVEKMMNGSFRVLITNWLTWQGVDLDLAQGEIEIVRFPLVSNVQEAARNGSRRADLVATLHLQLRRAGA